MSRLALACLCATFLATPAFADQWDDIIARKELRCGVYSDNQPFSAPDPKTRELVGFDVDLCKTLAKHLNLSPVLTPTSVEARVPEVQMGRVDVSVSNLAYTTSRAAQIAFSDPYYVAKEMLAVRASNPATSPADFKGKRLTAAKGSTSELSITLNGSEPVTFQDTGSAYLAVQQNKAQGLVSNTMTIMKLVNQSQTSGAPLKMLKEPMLLEPVAIGLKKDEPRLLAKVNEALYTMDKAGEIDAIWDKWLGQNTEFKLTRDEKVQPITAIHFTPIP